MYSQPETDSEIISDMDDDKEIQKLRDDTKRMKHLASTITFDKDIYCADRFEGYEQSIPVNDEDDNADFIENDFAKKVSSLTAPKQFFKHGLPTGDEEDDMPRLNKPSKIIDREDEYRRRWRFNRMLSPERVDPFLDKTPAKDARTYSDVMREEALKRREAEVKRQIAKKMKEIDNIEKPKKRNVFKDESDGSDWDSLDSTPAGIGTWDVLEAEVKGQIMKDNNKKPKKRNVLEAEVKRHIMKEIDNIEKPKKRNVLNDESDGSDWDSLDSTPAGIGTWDATPIVTKRTRWDEAPSPGEPNNLDATPKKNPAGRAWDSIKGLPRRKRSRWDESPFTQHSPEVC